MYPGTGPIFVTPTDLSCPTFDVVCAVERVALAIDGSMWPQFWLTLVATLAGAAAAILSSWLLERGAARAQYRDRVDDHVVRFIEAVLETARSLATENTGGIVKPHPWSRPKGVRAATSRVAAQPRLDQLLMLTDTLNLVCRGDDRSVAHALRTRVMEWGRVRAGGLVIIADPSRFTTSALDTTRILTAWRQRDTDEAQIVLWLHRATTPVDDNPNSRALREKWKRVPGPDIPRAARAEFGKAVQARQKR